MQLCLQVDKLFQRRFFVGVGEAYVLKYSCIQLSRASAVGRGEPIERVDYRMALVGTDCTVPALTLRASIVEMQVEVWVAVGAKCRSLEICIIMRGGTEI